MADEDNTSHSGPESLAGGGGDPPGSASFSRADRVIDVVYDWTRRHVGRIAGVMVAFLVGVIGSTLADPSLTFRQVPKRLFASLPLSVFVWVAIVILALLSLLARALRHHSKSRQFYERLAEVTKSRIADSMLPFSRGRIAWGMNVTLQSCPDLRRGWPLSEVQIEQSTEEFLIPPNLQASYRAFMDEQFWHQYQDDKPRLMLVENPTVFSDLPTLRLRVMNTKWSHFQFYRQRVLNDPAKRAQAIRRIVEGEPTIDTPNSLCLHLVVATSDGFLLLTENSPKKVSDYPGAWTFSLGEQLDRRDLAGSEEHCVHRWVERAVNEELGVPERMVREENTRALALVLEGDNVNCSLVTLAILDCGRSELDAIIDKTPRTDNEFAKWDFMRWDAIPGELLTPSRYYHPSTGIRMFYAGVFKLGATLMASRLVGQAVPR